MKIKICGMRNLENIEAIAALGIDYMGFIFYKKSARYFKDSRIDFQLPKEIKKVGVFVNATIEEIENEIKNNALDVIQLHGDESVEYCVAVSEICEVWKAFGVDEGFDWKLLRDYEKCCSHFLLDTKSITYGGSGKKFDWALLKHYNLDHPIVLSGGLNIHLLEEALALSKELPIEILDMNSGIEIEPGLKNVDLARIVVNKIRNYELSS